MSSSTTIFVLSSFLLLFIPTHAFNITRILHRYPEFTTFNNYLTQTKLADEINSRQTITVLAVDNANMGSLSGADPDDTREVLSLHVILDYLDFDKIRAIKRRSSVLTTLFQTTGLADQERGFLNLTKRHGQLLLGSAMPGSPLTSEILKVIFTRPYNVSVLQISSIVVPPGVGNIPVPPPVVIKNVTAPAPPPKKPESPAESPSDEADAPAPEADSPEAESPAPRSSPEGAPAGGPVADGPDGPAPGSTDQSSAGGVGIGRSLAGLIGIVTLLGS